MTLSLSDELIAQAVVLEGLLDPKADDFQTAPVVPAAELRRATRLLRTAADVLTVRPDARPDALEYIDNAIRQWRADTNPAHDSAMRSHYIDAFQSVRVSLFGDLLPA